MNADAITKHVPTDATALEALAETYRELPAMPKAVANTLRKLAGPDWTIEDVETSISDDPALVSRMISVSNSALYGGDHEFGTLHQALVRLGFRAIRSLVVVAAARALFPQDDTRVGSWGKDLWSHAVACGWSARMVAEAVGQKEPDDAFAAGVLHDVGKVVILLNRLDDFEKTLELVQGEGMASTDAEVAVVGIGHERLAAWLMAGWNLPAGVVAAVVGHHAPETAGEFDGLARIVATGNAISHLHAGSLGGDPTAEKTRLLTDLEKLGLTIGEAEELVDCIRVRLVSLTDLF